MGTFSSLFGLDASEQQRLAVLFRQYVEEWARGCKGWISCEDISAAVAKRLREAGFDAKVVHGDATFFDPDEGEVHDFHAWIVVDRKILDPKRLLLRMKRRRSRYWNYDPEP